MDVVFNSANIGNYLIMDNDSGYVSNNLDQESNSDSIPETLNNSSVEILKSLLPKSVYISEDALLERPDLDQTITVPTQEECTQDFPSLPCDSSQDVVVTSITTADKCATFPNFNSFQSDSGSSTPSVIVPVAEPIYYNLSTKTNSSLYAPIDYENISSNPSDGPFFGFENVPMEGSNKVHRNGLDIPRNESISTEADSIKNKENSTEPEVFKTPNKCRKRKFSEIGSPDLFPDDESNKAGPSVTPKVIEERFVHKLDHKLVKRVQKTISGVPPPPELTITNFTVHEMLEKLEANRSFFWTEENLRELKNESAEKEKTSLNGSLNSTFGCSNSILIEGQHEEAISKEFPEILYSRHHGLHYNRSKLSEEIEHICDKYARRYIGAETQSTCCALDTQYISPNKRRSAKPKWAVKSPGRRLSHLAKRRITFSSASLQASSSSSAASRARQILIDYKKLELLNPKKSPKKSPKKTPLKSPLLSPSNGRTPSSSAKRKLRMRFRLLSGNFNDSTSEPSSSISNSKRALFQSPEKDSQFRKNVPSSTSSISSTFERDLASRGTNTKRSLFSSPGKVGCRISLFSSPGKKSPFKNQQTFEKKRKRDADEDDENSNNKLKLFRSQSSHVVSQREPKSESSLTRTKSENVLMQSHNMTELSAANKKKLQWAVYESLKLQNISTTHPQFKVFASVLARVTRRCIVSLNIRLESSGTSEKMLRIARRHSYDVVKGKSVEEIMNEYNKSKTRNLKPQGYIAPQDYNPLSNKEFSFNKESALKDRDSNSVDSVTKLSYSQSTVAKPESRIDRIRKVINFEDNR